jgi:translation initiation factor 5
MPVLLTKIEGKGNGIKTVIPNMSDVARALSRPPTYTTKFFGCELGAQTSSDDKNDRYIVNGAHEATRLRELLDVFIEKFVLCKSCKNPETDLVVIKNRTEEIVRDCKACGKRTGVDMRHKLCTFILKTPPAKATKSKKGKTNGETNGNTVPTPADAHAGEGQEETHEAGAGSDDELTRRITAQAAELDDDSALNKEDWSADTSPEAVKQRIASLEGGIAAVVLGGGDDDGSDDGLNRPYAQLGTWVEANREVGAVAIYKKAQDLGIENKHKTVLVLVQALFTTDAVAEIPRYTPLLTKVNNLSLRMYLTVDAFASWSRQRSTKRRCWVVSSV